MTECNLLKGREQHFTSPKPKYVNQPNVQCFWVFFQRKLVFMQKTDSFRVNNREIALLMLVMCISMTQSARMHICVYKADRTLVKPVLDTTMKAVLLFVCVSLLVAAVISDDTYPTNWDNVNVDEVLSNSRLLEQYMKCLLDDNAKCSPDAAALKSK